MDLPDVCPLPPLVSGCLNGGNVRGKGAGPPQLTRINLVTPGSMGLHKPLQTVAAVPRVLERLPLLLFKTGKVSGEKLTKLNRTCLPACMLVRNPPWAMHLMHTEFQHVPHNPPSCFPWPGSNWICWVISWQ